MPGCARLSHLTGFVGGRVAVPRVGNGFGLSVPTALFYPPSPRPVVAFGGLRSAGGGLHERRVSFLRPRITRGFPRLLRVLDAAAEA